MMYNIYFASDSKRACAPHGGLRFLKRDFILKPPNLYYFVYDKKYLHIIIFAAACLYYIIPSLCYALQPLV